MDRGHVHSFVAKLDVSSDESRSFVAIRQRQSSERSAAAVTHRIKDSRSVEATPALAVFIFSLAPMALLLGQEETNSLCQPDLAATP
jgi:hypothetical protein